MDLVFRRLLFFLSSDHGVQIFEHCLLKKNALWILRHDSQASAIQFPVFKRTDITAFQSDLTPVGLSHATEQRQRRTLTGPITAYQCIKLTFSNFQ